MAQQAGRSGPGMIVSNGAGIVSSALTLAGFLVTLAVLSPVLAGIVVAATVPEMAAELGIARRRAELVAGLSHAERESMRPAYAAGDRVLVRRARVGQLRLGQVVVVEEPGRGGAWRSPPPRGRAGRHRWMIKRVVALPGDARPDDWLPATAGRPGPRVPAGSFVALGDNAARSYDSRQLGYFPGDRLLGVVLRRVHQGQPEAPAPGRLP